MKRIGLVLCVITLAACAREGPRQAASIFPKEVGAWKLRGTGFVVPTAVPDEVRGLGLKVAQSADYDGPGQLTALVCELTSGAGAFEAEQKWRPMADTVAFHKGSYFTVIHWQSADRAAVSAFVREMEKRLGE